MIASWLGASILFAQALVGGHGHGHRAPEADCCTRCGVVMPELVAQVNRLQTAPKWRDRERAAHALRRIDWKCHPEIVDVLASALLNDQHEEVREEAAQSLTRMAPCTVFAHEALARAAANDPDRSTRRCAAKGLKALTRRCGAGCHGCAVVADTLTRPPSATPAVEREIEVVPSLEPLPPVESSAQPSAAPTGSSAVERSPVTSETPSVPLEAPSAEPQGRRPTRAPSQQ